ncbi:MAG TPA: hypothetical protein VMS93_02340 [Candidatus Saccharimonadales bacterium]|nr:hypothetical protein [Candidatus Saccharimonadales bacterium]
MRRILAVSLMVALGAGLAAPCALAKGHILREGDVVKVKLEGDISAKGSATGDTVGVVIPEAWQRDPKGAPEIPAGTHGVITLKMGEPAGDKVAYDVTKLVFFPEGHRVTATTRVSPEGAGVIEVSGASFFKKLLLPPLLGFLFWHSHGSVDEGSEVSLEVRKRVDW